MRLWGWVLGFGRNSEELQEIKFLYKELVDKLIPVEKATQKEKKAIEEKDEVANEKELMQTLGWNECLLLKSSVSLE